MNQTLYIKAPQCIEVQSPNVTLQDIMTLYLEDTQVLEKIKQLPLYQFTEGKEQKIVVSILKVISLIQQHYPELIIENLGEGDFILSYEPVSHKLPVKEWLSTFFICLVAFFGGGYAIMAYNTDVGAKELFTNLSMLFLGNARSGVLYITLAYSVGLTFGMVLFFNHLGSKKLTPDPTPLEVQMRLYEKDIGTTIIKDVSRRGENMDIQQ